MLIAPHFVTEDMGRPRSRAKAGYGQGDLRQKLARWHADVDNAFNGWSGVWLDPNSANGTSPRNYLYPVPILIVQARLTSMARRARSSGARVCPVEVALLGAARCIAGG